MGVVQPISLIDAFAGAENIRASRQRAALLDREMQNQDRLRTLYAGGQRPTAEQVYAIDPQMGQQYEQNQLQRRQMDLRQRGQEMEYDQQKHAAVKNLATQALTKLEQSGITDPAQADAFVKQLQEQMRPYIQKVLGLPAQGDMGVEQLRMLADTTPGEQAKQAIAAKRAELEATMPYELAMEQQKRQFAQSDKETDAARALRNQKELEQYKQQFQAPPVTPYEKKKQEVQAQQDVENEQNAANTKMLATVVNDPRLEDLVKKSTSSYGGNVIDAVGRTVGMATGGAEAIAELQPEIARLVMLMPRGPGAQSDRDIQLAKDMAGDLANPNKAMGEKMASLKGLKAILPVIMQRYGGQMPAGNSAQSGGGASESFAGPGSFSSPEEIKAAVRSGAITKAQAKGILQSQFGFK